MFASFIFRLSILLVLISCQIDKASLPREQWDSYLFFVGTYTDGESKGIYAFELKPDGKLEDHGLAARTQNPSFLAKSLDKKTLFVVNELEQGMVESYRITGDSLVFLSRSESGGAHPCHITSNSQGYVFTANYSGGNVGLLRANADGILSKLLDVQQHTGKGVHKRQDAPHAHSVWISPFTNELISVDLGTNQLWISSVDTIKQQFKSAQTLDMTPGAGPRHLDFHPNGKWIYVLNELDATVTLIERTERGEYKKRNSVTTLPRDFDGYNLCADIHISGDGRFLYASNRGHNSIAIFAIHPRNGSLDQIGMESVRGEWPRNFALSPDGNFVIVANQHSQNMVVFRRDKQSGLLSFVDEMRVPSPVCVVF